MSARDLAATVEEGLTHPEDEAAYVLAKDALAALEKQAADARAANEILTENNRALQRSAVLNRDGRKIAEARAVRAEEALRQIAEMTEPQWEIGSARHIAREALAAAGADTETDG